ncbi:hypothetical protein MTO96_046750, partial [Rhipicephalus appendiculatus]
WFVGEWEECSTSCGNGTQLRLVFCQRRTEAGSVFTTDVDCESAGPKPERLQHCSSDAECASWEVGNWTEASRLAECYCCLPWTNLLFSTVADLAED